MMSSAQSSRLRWLTAPLLVLATVAWSPGAIAQQPAVGATLGIVEPGLSGVVRASQATPIQGAHVFIYSLADATLQKILTDGVGRFQLRDLPAGLYQVIAYKSGFVPAMVALTRPAANRQQILELDLLPADREVSTGEDYWQIRGSLPGDVLREIETLEVLQASVAGLAFDLPADARFRAGVEASAGLDEIAFDRAQRTGGRIGVEGQLAQLQLGVSGNFRRLDTNNLEASTDGLRGSSNEVSVDLAQNNDNRFRLTTARNRSIRTQDGLETPVDFEHLSVSYSMQVGQAGRSAFSAQVTDETNFYRGDAFAPLGVAGASKTWELEGSYSLNLSERSRVETGLRYRQRRAESSLLLDRDLERVDLFGKGGYRIRPALLIEYGIYSVLRDGELELAPQGGLVLQLNPEWQLATRASARLADPTPNDLLPPRVDFLPVLASSGLSACEHGEARCYEVALSRERGENLLSLGAVHREFGETVRLYFSDDFFDRSESLFLVPGDRLDELQLAVTRRLSPSVLTRLQSNVASGGGGSFQATVADAYENEIRYLITSIDTRFQATSTGVFLAFHQLEQSLNPIAANLDDLVPLLSERLQLRVTQDLNVLVDLPRTGPSSSTWSWRATRATTRIGSCGGAFSAVLPSSSEPGRHLAPGETQAVEFKSLKDIRSLG